MHKFLILLLFLLPFFWASCDYELTESNYIDVKKEPKPINLIYADNSISEIEVNGTCKLLFTTDSENRTHFTLQFKIDGLEVPFEWDTKLLSDSMRQFGVYIISDNLTDGKHSFEIEISSASGTGSLADISGNEQVIFYKTWQLLVNNTAPDSVIIHSIIPDKGGLNITWKKCNRKNFQSYILYKNTNFPPNQYYSYVKTITDPSDTTFYDNDFLGGYVSYKVNVNTSNKNSSGIEKGIEVKSPTVLKVENIDETTCKIYWSRCKIDNNFSSYILTLNLIGDQIILFSSKNINDTTCITDRIPYGGAQELELFTSSNSYFSTNSLYEHVFGKKIPYFKLCRYVKNTNSVYTLNEDYKSISRYDAQTMQELNKIDISGYFTTLQNLPPVSFDVSDDGKYCYFYAGDYIYKLDPLTLVVEDKYSIKDLLGIKALLINMDVSDNNLLVCYVYRYYTGDTYHYDGYNEDGVYLIDLTREKMLDRIFAWSLIPSISYNGNIVIMRNEYYKFSSDSLSLFYTSDFFGHSIFTSDGQSIIEGIQYSINIRDCNNGDLIKSISINGNPTDLWYDIKTGLLGFRVDKENDKYFILDLESGKIIKEFYLGQYITSISFFNSTVFLNSRFNEGCYLNLNLN